VKPAPEAQTDQSTRPVDQSASNNIYSASTGSGVTTADQHADQSREQEQFVCPECGKSFSKESSLKAHMLAKHRIAVQWRKGREAPSPATRESGKGRGEEEEELGIPDPYEHLRQMLITFGLRPKDADAVVKFMEPYSVDDIYKLLEATSTYMPKSRLRLFIESWCNVRQIPVPPEIAEDLGLDLATPAHYNYSYRFGRMRRSIYENEPEPPKESTAAIINSLGNFIRSISPPTPKADNNNYVNAVLQQNQQLQAEIAKLREELRKQELEMLKKEIERLREEMKYQRGVTNQFDLTLKLLDNLHDTVKDAVDFVKKLARVPRPMEEAPTYREEEEATPTEEEVKSLLGEEYVEEE